MKQFKETKVLVFCALMAAFAIVLGFVATIEIGPFIRISLSGIPNRVIEFTLGPIVGSIFGGMLDILKYLIRPTGPYFFGFTFNAILAGTIYGMFLYKKPVKITRILIAELLVKLLVNCVFGTLWLTMLYGSPFVVILPARLLKNLIMWPIDSMILLVVLRYMDKTIKPMLFSKNH